MNNSGAISTREPLSQSQIDFLKKQCPLKVPDKTRKPSIEFLQAIKFEHITDGECWLRSNGRITVRMKAQKDLFIFTGPPREIQVYSGGDSLFDIPGITNQLANIMFEQLRGNPALLHFIGMTETSIKIGWSTQVQQWLADDIRADPDVFDYLQCRAELGSKIIIENAFRRKAIELEIKFEQGLCHFDVMVDRFATGFAALFDSPLVFDHPQLASAKRMIAPKLAEAVRDPDFSHPYPDHAIKSVLEIKSGIINAAVRLEVSPLALAGIIADEYEKDLAPKQKQADVNDEAFIARVVNRFYKPVDPIISFGLFVIGKIYEPIPGPLDVLDLWWAMLSPKEKKDLLVRAGTALKESFSNPLKHYLNKKVEMKDNESHLELWTNINVEAMIAALKPEDLKQFNQNILSTATKYNLLDLIDICYGLYRVGKPDSIKNRAAQIQVHLDHAKLPPEQREYICKWERLHSRFKA